MQIGIETAAFGALEGDDAATPAATATAMSWLQSGSAELAQADAAAHTEASRTKEMAKQLHLKHMVCA